MYTFSKLVFGNLILTLVFPFCLMAQEEGWDVYMAQYEKGPGSTVINMALRQVAPVKNLPYILVTGVKFKDCGNDGFPSKAEFNTLYKISDSVKTIIEHHITNKLAGTFTYQCERLDYYYISDTAGIRQKLTGLYTKRFKEYEPYISIKQDMDWKAYLDFLYPTEDIYESMTNQKVVLKLQQAGDKLEKERQVDHWIYFTTENDQNCFISYATSNKFKIESKGQTKDPKRPFKLQISRIDKADLSSISKITLELRKQAERCKGDYDGWETFVIK